MSFPKVGDSIVWTEFRGKPNEHQFKGTVTEVLGDVSVCFRVISKERNCIVHAFKIDSVEAKES